MVLAKAQESAAGRKHLAFRLPDHWVWDFWLADDGDRYHLFYLHAPKSLGDPQLRHRNARIGHASSTDLRWTNHGTNQGIFGLAPDGRPVSFTGIAIWRVQDGRLAECWVERAALEGYLSLTQ